MSLSGTVHAINRQRGMVAILTDDHGYTIIELLADDEIAIGDEMIWENDTGLGHEMYQNRTKKRSMEVFVQNHWVSERQLKQQLLIQ